MIERMPGENITLETRNIAEKQVNKNLRYKQILEILGDDEMTAKEIANEMWMRSLTPSNDRNFVSPRLTELSIKGIVEPVGKRKCLWTDKMVSVYKKRKDD